jgi:L-ascorbate metabolism protein UlaG (beta-lactamase superfamily)
MLGTALLLGCGHVVYKAPNHYGERFDFKRPPCHPAGEPPDDGRVAIRYLGAGGLAIRWRGQILLTAPFFSNYGFPRVPFGRLAPNRRAIWQGMQGIPPARVGAILAGHSHYDHLGDLPIVATDFAPRARIYVNDSGVKLLRHALGTRVESLEGSLGKPVPLTDASQHALPFRVFAVRSEHAPHFLRYHWAGGQVRGGFWEKPWEHLTLWHMRTGTTLSFVIELLDERGKVRYRLYYQDAASPAAVGAPPAATVDRHGFDLAVLCMPAYNLVDDAPGWLLGKLQPRHVLAFHYENFFHGLSDPLEFAPLLTDPLANAYLAHIDKALGEEARKPLGSVCGPSSRKWTMPLPGEWLSFQLVD